MLLIWRVVYSAFKPAHRKTRSSIVPSRKSKKPQQKQNPKTLTFGLPPHPAQALMQRWKTQTWHRCMCCTDKLAPKHNRSKDRQTGSTSRSPGRAEMQPSPPMCREGRPTASRGAAHPTSACRSTQQQLQLPARPASCNALCDDSTLCLTLVLRHTFPDQAWCCSWAACFCGQHAPTSHHGHCLRCHQNVTAVT